MPCGQPAEYFDHVVDDLLIVDPGFVVVELLEFPDKPLGFAGLRYSGPTSSSSSSPGALAFLVAPRPGLFACIGGVI